jgi:hypothetical protein
MNEDCKGPIQQEVGGHDQRIEWLKRMAFVALSAVVMLQGGGQYAIKLFDEYGAPLRRVDSNDID